MQISLSYLVKLFSLSVVLAALVVIPASWFFYQNYLDQPLELMSEELIFTVPENSNLYAVSSELALSGYLKYPRLLVWHARLGDQTNIKAGEYRFLSTTTMAGLVEQLNRGEVIQHSITFVEGRTVSEFLQVLWEDARVNSLLADKTEAEIIQALEMDVEHLEGWFYPDTYFFSRGMTDIEILRQAHARMRDVLAEEWVVRDAGLPYDTAYEALIMASIVEKETGAAWERPEIAGVFVRRLQKGMRLQTDPTVIYGLGPEFDGNLRRSHLSQETPYNTYRIRGLPPTPIAAAGREAIEAALHPAPGETLYFVARGDGTHQFSVSLEEHNAAVRHYQIEQRAENYQSSPPATN